MPNLGGRLGKRRLLNAGISLLTLLVLVPIAEAVVRHVFRDVTTTADGGGYFGQRWYQAQRPRKNLWGFRERDFEREKPSRIYRIAVIGDSFTYGQGIEEESRFTNLLQQRLHGSAKAYEVLNFGRWGAETVDQLDILTQTVLPSTPDFVLLQWFMNDVEGHDKTARPRPWPLLPSHRLFTGLLARSALFHLLNVRWVSIQEQLGWVKSYGAYMRERFGDPHSPASLAAQQALQQLIATCKQRSVPLGLVLFSNPYAGGGPLDFLLDRVLALCEQEALTCVDTRATFAPYGDERELWVNRLDPHPGPLAHRLVADRLMAVFGESWGASAAKGP